ncbi:MAG: NGG1p interacting factor NIF3 [Candidatus Omnitrophota bacterium]
MKLGKLYEQIVKIGIDNDPRGKAAVSKALSEKRKEYEELKKGKQYFDLDNLFNPYPDTRILYGDKEKQIKTIFVGIDISGEELLLIDRLNQTSQTKVDLAISHHPAGKALASLFEVMPMQAEILAQYGVPIAVGEALTQERLKEVERRFMPINHMRAVDTATLLDIPFLCMHTAADNCAASFLKNIFDKKKPHTLQDILDILNEIPEYKYAASNKCPAKIIQGSSKSKAGKILVDMTGGTEGSKDVFLRLATSGISTLVCMHLSEEHFKNAEKERLNIVIAGHISSDSLGMNIIFDNLEKQEKFKLICASGFKRFQR